MLPKSVYVNQLITQVAFLRYRQGIPMGRLCGQLGIGLGAVFEILHRMAALLRGVLGKLIVEYRQAPTHRDSRNASALNSYATALRRIGHSANP